jgi:hypothetical protein
MRHLRSSFASDDPSDICSLRRQINMVSVAVFRSIEPESRVLDGRAVLPSPQTETAAEIQTRTLPVSGAS